MKTLIFFPPPISPPHQVNKVLRFRRVVKATKREYYRITLNDDLSPSLAVNRRKKTNIESRTDSISYNTLYTLPVNYDTFT